MEFEWNTALDKSGSYLNDLVLLRVDVFVGGLD